MFELIVCIINRGFSDTVMTAARGSGARGGTILHAKGTGSHEAERFFGITIQPEKEIVLILVPKEIRSDVMSAIASSCGWPRRAAESHFPSRWKTCWDWCPDGLKASEPRPQASKARPSPNRAAVPPGKARDGPLRTDGMSCVIQ